METHLKNSTNFINSIYINDIDNKYNQYYYGKAIEYNNKKCWFCDSSCKNFVNICNDCKHKKLKKIYY